MTKFKSAMLAGFAVAFASVAAPASATTISFAGNFVQDDDVQLFNFNILTQSLVTFRSFSYAGGMNGDGTPIERGGFDPVLALFDSLGTLIDQADDGDAPDVGTDPFTGQDYDSFFQAVLLAGTYTVSITQYNNLAIGPTLADGFLKQGQGNFTGLIGGCSQGFFCDYSDADPYNNRDGHFAFDVTIIPDAPIPAALPLLASGLAAFGFMSRRKRNAADIHLHN
jgi:hypothetical protein